MSSLTFLNRRREICIHAIEKNENILTQLQTTCKKAHSDCDALENNPNGVAKNSVATSIAKHRRHYIEILEQCDECQLTIQLLENELSTIQEELQNAHWDYVV